MLVSSVQKQHWEHSKFSCKAGWGQEGDNRAEGWAETLWLGLLSSQCLSNRFHCALADHSLEMPHPYTASASFYPASIVFLYRPGSFAHSFPPSDSLAHIYDLNSSHFLWVLHISLTIWCWYSIQDDSKWGQWAQRPALLRKSDEGIMIQKPLRENVSGLRWNGKLTESSEQICFPFWPEEHKGKPWQDALCKGHAVWRKWVVANPQVNPCNFLGLLPIRFETTIRLE